MQRWYHPLQALAVVVLEGAERKAKRGRIDPRACCLVRLTLCHLHLASEAASRQPAAGEAIREPALVGRLILVLRWLPLTRREEMPPVQESSSRVSLDHPPRYQTIQARELWLWIPPALPRAAWEAAEAEQASVKAMDRAAGCKARALARAETAQDEALTRMRAAASLPTPERVGAGQA